MSEPFLGEIRFVSFPNPPKGWAACNGQLLPINQYQALFSLLGTTYGGNGIQTFGLPNLQGRVPIHQLNGQTGANGGEENHTLTTAEIPQHSHPLMASTRAAASRNPAGSFLATGFPAYAGGSPNTTFEPSSITAAGGSQPHSNMQPYLTLNGIIALQGIFPSRN